MKFLIDLIANAIFDYAFDKARDLIIDPETNQLRPEFQTRLEARLAEEP